MSMIRETNEKTFNDIYSSADDFLADSKTYSFEDTISDEAMKSTFYLLTMYYGDCITMGYTNEARWKLKLFGTISTYGPA